MIEPKAQASICQSLVDSDLRRWRFLWLLRRRPAPSPLRCEDTPTGRRALGDLWADEDVLGKTLNPKPSCELIREDSDLTVDV